jgi:F-type H+-transporting ATPase subunit b
MFFTPEFWVLVAFLIFMGIAGYAGAFNKIIDSLDARGRRVRQELEEARRLREEAAAVLADYRRRAKEAEQEAEAIISAAREEAERTAREGHERITDFVARRTAAAEAKIAQAEASATQAVRAAAAEAAIKVSEAVLRDEVRGPLGQELITKGLGEVKSKLHS